MFKLKSLKAIDFFRKIPTDLTEATLSGASISLIAAFVMTFLFGMELHSYLQTTTSTSIMVDQSSPGELLKINFNIRKGPMKPSSRFASQLLTVTSASAASLPCRASS